MSSQPTSPQVRAEPLTPPQQPLPSSPLSPPQELDDFILKSDGRIAILLSLFYLGATSNKCAVMESDVLNEGKNFTTKFHKSPFKGGKYNSGIHHKEKLQDKGFVKSYTHKDKTYETWLVYLTEKGNTAARELVKREIPQCTQFISYSSYERMPIFEDIQYAILCVLYAHGAFFGTKSLVYPFIVTRISHMIGGIRYIDNNDITPEYAALAKLMAQGLVEKTWDKEATHKFYLTIEGENYVELIKGDHKIQEFLSTAEERKDTIKVAQKRKRSPPKETNRHIDELFPPAATGTQTETAQTSDEPPTKKRACYTGSSYDVIDLTYDVMDLTNDVMDLTDDEGHLDVEPVNTGITTQRENVHQNMRDIDLFIAQQYPPLNMNEVFSEVPQLRGIAAPPGIIRVKLVVDSRENSKMKEAITSEFKTQGLNCEIKPLYTGDYTWVATGVDGKDYLLNSIIERKTVPDFDRAYHCYGDNRFYNQLRKMYASKISNILYLIEGYVKENSFFNVEFDDMEDHIMDVHKISGLTLIRTMSMEQTISFLVDITKSLESVLKEGKLTENFFAYPLKDVDGLRSECLSENNN